ANPNNPTGHLLPPDVLEPLLRRVPARTRVWLDEAYLDYCGPGQSLEGLAAGSPNVVVCKSLSKVYALSGARAAYLCGAADVIEPLRRRTPPWVVSLPAQVAAVHALRRPDYYAARYRETDELRRRLADRLETLGLKVVCGGANFLLCRLPADGPDADAVLARCRTEGLYLRGVRGMGG